MTDSEYKQLAEFQGLPLYDDDHPLCSTVDLPEKEALDGTIWLAVHEATDLNTAREYLKREELILRGGIRYWNGDRKSSTIYVYFWEKK
jgi:hypothetical protein